MRKALILTVLAFFGSEALAQKSFRHTQTVALDDLQDNEMALNLNYQGAVRDAIRLGNNDYRVKVGRWDDAQDNEMDFQGAVNTALKHYGNAHRIGFDEAEDNEMFGGRGTIGGPTVLINRPTGGRMGMMDDFEDDVLMSAWDEMDEIYGRAGGGFVPFDTFRADNPSFLGSGNSGVIVQGGNAPQGGIGASGSGQVVGNIGNTGAQYIVGATVAHNPGAPVTINPHVGIKIGF